MKQDSLGYGSVWERNVPYNTWLYSGYGAEIPGGIPMGADVTPTQLRVGLRMRRYQVDGSITGALRVQIQLEGYATQSIDLTTANEWDNGLFPTYILEGDAAYWGMDDLQFKSFLNTLMTNNSLSPGDPAISINSQAISESDPMQLQVQYMWTQVEYDYEVPPPAPGAGVKFAPGKF